MAGDVRIEDHGVVAVVRLDDLSSVARITNALIHGGVTAIEFTYTNPKAGEAISAARAIASGSGVIGAGTVLDPETARAAILAGAEYIVTPTFKRETVELCNRYGVATIVGAFTATEMLTAWEAGASYIKVHPASLGGPKYFKDILGPLPQLKLIPSGGVTLENAVEYIRAGAVAVAMGANLVNKKTVQTEGWDELTSRARGLSSAVKAAQVERLTSG
ncbi:MAG: bifunctional 4-hydroxy-2-oxoglutarate aldolase/2-dehydro-3-deoxy-phosphogluconate aldolase [Thermomicrobiales bacterium]